jgi:hypothetical protein
MDTPSATEPRDATGLPANGSLLTILAWFCAFLLAAVVVLLVAGLVYSAFHSSLLGTLRDATPLFQFLGNLLVVFYAFPAFMRTKDRAFLCIAVAALGFGYLGLFSILFSVGPPATTNWRMSHGEAHWYYTARYTIDLVGFVFYTYGIVSLARRAKA